MGRLGQQTFITSSCRRLSRNPGVAQRQVSGLGVSPPQPRWPQGSWSPGFPTWKERCRLLSSPAWLLAHGSCSLASAEMSVPCLRRSLSKENLTTRKLDSPGATANGQGESLAPCATQSQKPPFLSFSIHSKEVTGLSPPPKGEGYTEVGIGVSGAT